MKRILLAISLMFLMCSSVFAATSVKLVDDNDVNIDSRGYLSHTISGTNQGWYVVSQSNIPAGYLILGYSVWITSTNYDLRVALYDDNSSNVAYGIILNESEQSATDYSPHWFPYPKKLNYGLVVWIGGGVDVTIYYTK